MGFFTFKLEKKKNYYTTNKKLFQWKIDGSGWDLYFYCSFASRWLAFQIPGHVHYVASTERKEGFAFTYCNIS